ncbi:hypothetical protein [Priestia megaterium]|uniref:hypothetical protein n=1 Tax=Priestia megaterium TaxID=1404 RepID=UPI001A943D47|nr:hypothetical protein [Priestia megaterium]QSX18453.1 hypothetical protein J0P05_14305 [Priestia megaterium]
MPEPKVKFKKIWEDEDLIELNMAVDSPYCYANINFYTTNEELEELRGDLISFSNFKYKECEWVKGEDTENAVCYIRLRFFHFDNQGHVGIEFLLDNKLEIPDMMRLNFHLMTELNQIDDFIYKLHDLIKMKTNQIESILEVRI